MRRVNWWIIPVLLVITWWGIKTGKLALLLLWVAAFLGNTGGQGRKKRAEETDKNLGDVKDVLSQHDEIVGKHREEVKKVEEKDYSALPLDDLLAHANDRERRRSDPVDF